MPRKLQKQSHIRDDRATNMYHVSGSGLHRSNAQRAAAPAIYPALTDPLALEHWHSSNGGEHLVSYFEMSESNQPIIEHSYETCGGFKHLCSDCGTMECSCSKPKLFELACFRCRGSGSPSATQPNASHDRDFPDVYSDDRPPKPPKLPISSPGFFEGEEEAIRESLRDQEALKQEAEEQEVLLRALATQEALLTRLTANRAEERQMQEQEATIRDLRTRLIALER